MFKNEIIIPNYFFSFEPKIFNHGVVRNHEKSVDNIIVQNVTRVKVNYVLFFYN